LKKSANGKAAILSKRPITHLCPPRQLLFAFATVLSAHRACCPLSPRPSHSYSGAFGARGASSARRA